MKWIVGVGVAVVVFLAFLGVNILPLLFLAAVSAGLWFMMDRRQMAPLAMRDNQVKHQVSFDEIGGQEHAKRELMEALDFLRYRDRINHSAFVR